MALLCTALVLLTTVLSSSSGIATLLRDLDLVFSESGDNTKEIIYVDDDNTEGPWNGSLEFPYNHIQDAVNHSNDGDTIYVFNGIYYENVWVNQTIHLIGEDKNHTIVDGGFKSYCVFLYSNNIYLSGFTFQNSGTHWYNDAGVSIKNSRLHSNHDTIIGNIMKYNYDGIFLNWAENNTITENLIINNTDDGIYFQSYDHNNNITSNTIANNGAYGIFITGNNNTISRNYIYDNEIGIGLYDDTNVYENFIENSTYGIIVGYGINYIYRNTFTKNLVGLDLQGAPCCTIKENNFIKNIRDAKFSYDILQRLILPFFVFPQLTKWKNNYWDGHDGGQKIILGNMILCFLLHIIIDEFFDIQTIGIPWLNIDWNPAQEPYDIGGE